MILISLDGTRPRDIDSAHLPALEKLMMRGARAPGLVPPLPSNTFPSHVTMATGVAPERHGIVNNYFFDPVRGDFQRKDIPSWIEVEPIWSILDRAGIVSASYYWVGSEGPWRGGHGPKHWKKFSSRTTEIKKVEKILEWLDLADPAQRPRLITAWFHGADHSGHVYGPGSRPVREALEKQDPAIAALVAGIEERGLWPSTTLMLVSDHGMAPVKHFVDFDRALKRAGVRARVIGVGGFAIVLLRELPGTPAEASKPDAVPDPARVQRVVAVAREQGLEAIPRRGAPAELRIAHRRFGDLVVRAPLGTAIYRFGLPKGGFHGYDPQEPPMHGMFIAAGRGVEPGRELPLVRAIDVAPTVLRLLGVAVPDWMEGVPVAGIGEQLAVETRAAASAKLSEGVFPKEMDEVK